MGRLLNVKKFQSRNKTKFTNKSEAAIKQQRNLLQAGLIVPSLVVVASALHIEGLC